MLRKQTVLHSLKMASRILKSDLLTRMLLLKNSSQFIYLSSSFVPSFRLLQLMAGITILVYKFMTANNTAEPFEHWKFAQCGGTVSLRSASIAFVNTRA